MPIIQDLNDLNVFFISVAEEQDSLKMAKMADEELRECAAWLGNVSGCNGGGGYE